MRPTLFVTEDNRAVIGPWPDTPCQAVSGNVMLVEHGVSAGNLHTEPLWDERHPRTAAAVDRTGRILWLVVVDGRQPGYSEGVTLAELAEIIVAAGAETAVNLDGGGSSVLVMAAPDGIAEQVSTPLTFRRWVGRERPVANHFGLYARRVSGSH